MKRKLISDAWRAKPGDVSRYMYTCCHGILIVTGRHLHSMYLYLHQTLESVMFGKNQRPINNNFELKPEEQRVSNC